jgi:predicted ester cyclase
MGQARNVVEQWWSLFEADRLEETARVCQPDVEVRLPGDMRLLGPDEVIATLGAFREAFPDMRHELLDVVESADKVAVELVVTATHTGTFRTPQGDVLATGRPVAWHTYFGQMAFLAQLGLLPEPATV